MSSPALVCFACGKPTTVNKPVCDACAGTAPAPVTCVFCERGVALDKSGVLHVTKGGGHVGPCALAVLQDQSPL